MLLDLQRQRIRLQVLLVPRPDDLPLVEDVLHERFKDEPALPVHPDLAGIELPY